MGGEGEEVEEVGVEGGEEEVERGGQRRRQSSRAPPSLLDAATVSEKRGKAPLLPFQNLISPPVSSFQEVPSLALGANF